MQLLSNRKPYLFLGVLLIAVSICSRSLVLAQEPQSATGVGTTVNIPDKNAKSGNIVSFQNGAYVLTTVPYDPTLYGVISPNTAVSIIDTTEENAKIVVTSGKTSVLVTTRNGSIKKGDLITSSPIPGVGQKATEQGYVIGSSEEDFSGSEIRSILVDIHPQLSQLSAPNKQNLFNALRYGITTTQVNPINTLRYLSAALLTIGMFVIGFLFFGRATNRGIEAVGRNPLAKRIIILTVILNVVLTLVIMLAGIAMSYLILVL